LKYGIHMIYGTNRLTHRQRQTVYRMPPILFFNDDKAYLGNKYVLNKDLSFTITASTF